MNTNTHTNNTQTPAPSILGHRQLTPSQLELVNRIKAKGDEVGHLVDQLQATLSPTLDQRWIATGKTDLQKGFMCLVRGVAQPTTF